MPHIPIRESPPEIEQRTTPGSVELRGGVGKSRTIGGYGSVFDKRSQLLGSFVEIVDRRCWAKSAGDGYPGVVARFNHDDSALLGTVASGSLALSVDNVGLSYSVDLPNTSVGNDVGELVARGDVSGSSVAFQCWEDSWGYGDGVALRTLVSCRLIDCSPVVSPAYPDATVGLRSLSRAVGADFADVQRYAESDQLAKFFVRSDRSSRPMSGRVAMVETLRKRWPAPQPSAPMSAVARRVELLGKRWGPRD
jgi:HK97 family phage prohead protease